MAKHKTYEVKDYDSGWAAKEITSDMNELARQGDEVQHTLLTGFHNEVSRYSDPLPGLNDGDSISSLGTMRIVYVK